MNNLNIVYFISNILHVDMSWTPEKVAKLKDLWGKGSTASQIAEILGGVSRNAVIGKAHRLNLSGKIMAKKGSSYSKVNSSKLTSDNRKFKKGRFKYFYCSEYL